MKKRLYLATGVLLILIGLSLGFAGLAGRFESKNSQPFISPSVAAQLKNADKNGATISGTPSHIEIPSLNISINVDPGYYNARSQTWSLSLTDAEYATMTPPANNKSGNTFIYGHNRLAVFEKLLKVKTGDKAILTTSNNHTFTYTLVAQQTTQPNDVSLFNYQGPPILTLQTCSGIFYQHRSLFIFSLDKAV